MQQSPGYYVTPPPYFDKKKIDERKLELTKPTWSSRLLFHAKWIFLYIWVTALVTLIVLLSKFGSVSMPHTACRPDRTFSLYKENFSRWPRSTFFEVTVAGGSFSFTQAKMIDITWDLIVGRVGQAALAYFSWRAFSDYAAVAMETRPVNYSVFRTIFISQEASIGSLWCLIRNIRLGRAWRSTTAMCFVITSLAFTLAFPTLAGAITGYVAAVDAYIVGKDGLAIKFSDFDFVAYILRDGSLIYLGDNYLVPYHPTEPNVPPGGQLERGEPLLLPEGSMEDPAPKRCRLFRPGCERAGNVSAYVTDYGFHGLQQSWTWWYVSGIPNTVIGAPMLNISAYYLFPPREEPVSYDLKGCNWADPEKFGEHPFQNKSNIRFMTRFDHQTVYDIEYIQTHGICQQIPNRYQWGFSFLPLFLLIIALLIWTVGVVLMYCKTSFCLPLVGYPEVPRGSRCILHYADAMRDQLLRENIDPGGLTKKELDKEITNRLGGGSVSWAEPLSPNCVGLFRGFRRWLSRENWWWPAIFVFQASIFLVSLITFGFTREYVTVVLISWVASLSVYLVILTGQSRGNGIVLFICVCMVLFASAGLTLTWAVIR